VRAVWQRDDKTTRRIAVACLLAAMAIAAALLLIETRGLTLLFDEWDFGYSARTGHDLSTFLTPHNGHLVALPVVVYKTVLQVFGVSGAPVFRVITVGVHLSVVGLVYVLLRRVLSPVAALAPSILVLFLGAANDVFLGSHAWPLSLSVATGLAAWLALGKRRPSLDIVATVLLTAGVCSDGYALPFTVGAVAIVLLDRKSPRSRLWVPAVPLFVFGVWWLIEGRSESIASVASFVALPSFFFDSLAAALGTLTGTFTAPGVRTVSFDIAPGQALAGATLVSVLALVMGWRYRPPRTIIPPLAALLTFWFLTAGAASLLRLPTSGRYLYVSVILLILILVEALAASRVRNQGAVALTAICVVALLPNIREITYASDIVREQSEVNRAVLGAADLLVASNAPANAIIETPEEGERGNVVDLYHSLGAYAAGRERFGTPAFSAGEIKRADPSARAAADRVIAHALGPHIEPVETAPQPLPARTEAEQTGGTLERVNGCLRFRPLVAGAQLTIGLPAGGLWIRLSGGPAAPVGLRRFADTFEIQIGPILGKVPSVVAMPGGPASVNWEAQILPAQPVLLCGAQS